MIIGKNQNIIRHIFMPLIFSLSFHCYLEYVFSHFDNIHALLNREVCSSCNIARYDGYTIHSINGSRLHVFSDDGDMILFTIYLDSCFNLTNAA